MADHAPLPVIAIGDLAVAIPAAQLRLVYQPKIRLSTISGVNEIAGVEAFARWRHPKWGDIPPDAFIPLVEANDLIHPFTEWIVAQAAADWAAWHRQGLTMNVAVNVSAKNFRREFPDMVEGLCQAQGMPCRHMTVELTESAEQTVLSLQDSLTRLRIKGMGVSLDDFGTGYSSLLQLHQLPLSEIKIDQCFVTHADKSDQARIIIRSTIGLAHELGLRVVAEGIETAAVAHLLAELGCDMGQGYFFARPMSATDLFDWVLSPPNAGYPDCASAG